MTIFYYNSDKMDINEFLDRNQEKINEATIEAIKKCIYSDMDQIVYMKIKPDNSKYLIRRPNFKKFLNSAISYYEKEEMYEKCSECLELINLID